MTLHTLQMDILWNPEIEHYAVVNKRKWYLILQWIEWMRLMAN